MGGRGAGGGEPVGQGALDVLEGYVNTDNPVENEYLRTGEVPSNAIETEAEIKDNIGKLDSLVASNTLDKDTTLYSGTDHYSDAKVGDTISDKGFESTSTDSETAEGFGDTVIVYDAPAGTNAIDVSSALAGRGTPNEDEHILGRGSSYTVTRVETRSGEWGGTKTYVYVK